MAKHYEHRGPGVPWPPAIKEAALSRASEVGSVQAALESGVPYDTVRHWIAKASGDERAKVTRAQYDDERRSTAVALAHDIGAKAASAQMGVPLQTLVRWMDLPDKRRTLNTYTEEFRARAVARALATSAKLASKELGLNTATLRAWVTQAIPLKERRVVQSYSTHEIEEAVALAKALGVIPAADKLGMPETTLRTWLREASPDSTPRSKRASPARYDEAFVRQVLDVVSSKGFVQACAEFNINDSTARRWAKAAGVSQPKQIGKTQSWDTSMQWLVRSSSQLEDWRSLAEQWLQLSHTAVSARINALRIFFKKYVIGLKLSTAVEELLSRFYKAPPPELAFPSTHYGTYSRNYVAEFIDWVLLTRFADTDAGGHVFLDPLFRNPIGKASHSGDGRGFESVYSYLPHEYLVQCRKIIAEGPNFQDWKWAQQQLGVEAGAPGGVAPEWFEVPRSVIDEGDPDCVWRRRARSTSSGGAIYEIWSPVRWVAQLVKATLPQRTHQIRVLDSGESDTWTYSLTEAGGSWELNASPLRRGTVQRPVEQGVFRRPARELRDMQTTPPRGWSNAVLYINTNKTADSKKTGARKGYSFPWLVSGGRESDVFYWLHKLRTWQQKFNPIEQPTSWEELDGRHIKRKSKGQLAGFPDTCFLFRLPEQRGGLTHLPIPQGMLDLTWYSVLGELETRLASEGKTHADGSRITLIYSENPKAKKTYFPPHSVRVAIATALADAGLPITTLMRILGHSRIAMTIYYRKRGQYEMALHLEVAQGKLRDNGDDLLRNWLKNTEHERLLERIIGNDDDSLLSAIPKSPAARNQLGWMPVGLGMCIVGGNVSPYEGGERTAGGCYNGGPSIGSTSKRKHGPVPGGAKNCGRCRWLVTAAHYLPAIVDACNIVLFHLHESKVAYLDAERRYQAIREQQIKEEESMAGGIEKSPASPSEREIEALRKKSEWCLQRFSDRAEDLAALMRLVERCRTTLLNDSEPAEQSRRLLAVGTREEIEVSMKDVPSEMEHLDLVCESLEIYPEAEASAAILRRSQLIDAALALEGMQPIFFALGREDQLRLGNELTQRLARDANPENPLLGRRKVIEIVDARRNLSSALGIDVKALVATVQASPFIRQLGRAP